MTTVRLGKNFGTASKFRPAPGNARRRRSFSVVGAATSRNQRVRSIIAVQSRGYRSRNAAGKKHTTMEIVRALIFLLLSLAATNSDPMRSKCFRPLPAISVLMCGLHVCMRTSSYLPLTALYYCIHNRSV